MPQLDVEQTSCAQQQPCCPIQSKSEVTICLAPVLVVAIRSVVAEIILRVAIRSAAPVRKYRGMWIYLIYVLSAPVVKRGSTDRATPKPRVWMVACRLL